MAEPMATRYAQAMADPFTDPLTAARRHRAELLDTIHSVERALAVPAGDPAWRPGGARQVARLRQVFADHVSITEGVGGLYASLLGDAPRLANAVDVLVREHADIGGTLEGLAAEPDPDPERLRAWASTALHDLSRHRQRGADLIYEAYVTDIGGED